MPPNSAFSNKMSSSPRILIVDDSNTIREIIRMVVETIGCEVVAEGESGEEAITLFGEHQPDITLMDIEMPGMGGIRAVTEIIQTHPSAYILMLSGVDPDIAMESVFVAGAADYVKKGDDLELMIEELQPHIAKFQH
ncbi:MAG: response regulator transcription factor [Gammaproteobacteria bacterium]|nr:response regulator transcription factor [Gammaproteobacteria bacterium]